MDTEKSFPKTVYEAIWDRRKSIREHMSTKAPSKKIKFDGIMVTLFGEKKPEGVVHFGFVYSRKLNQYFRFVDNKPIDYFNRLFAPMHLFLIVENEPVWVAKFNIILSAPVYYPPRVTNAYGIVPYDSEWYCFKHGLHNYGTEGLTEEELTVDGLIKSMDSSWESFVMLHGIKTSD